MKEQTTKQNKTRNAKLLLLTGRKFSVRELNRTLDVNNSPEIVRNLRKEMDIRTEWEDIRKRHPVRGLLLREASKGEPNKGRDLFKSIVRHLNNNQASHMLNG